MICFFVGVQKYYLPSGAGYPSYATERWGIRFRSQPEAGVLTQDFQPLTSKC